MRPRAAAVPAALVLSLTGCSDDDGPDAITERDVAGLVDRCEEAAGDPSGCEAWVAGIIEELEPEGCSLGDISAAVSFGLGTEGDRRSVDLDCIDGTYRPEPAP